jgi:hypothetical protein
LGHEKRLQRKQLNVEEKAQFGIIEYVFLTLKFPFQTKMKKTVMDDFIPIPGADWTPYQRRIWDSFEGLVDELMRGSEGTPSAADLGLFKGKPAVLAWSNFDDDILDELFIYPAEESEHPSYEEVIDV